MSDLVPHSLAMGLADGCPSCVDNVEPPRSAVPVENGWRCAYLCICGHAWTTDWNAESLADVGFRRDSVGGEWDNSQAKQSGPGGAANATCLGLTDDRSAG